MLIIFSLIIFKLYVGNAVANTPSQLSELAQRPLVGPLDQEIIRSQAGTKST